MSFVGIDFIKELSCIVVDVNEEQSFCQMMQKKCINYLESQKEQLTSF